MRSFRTKLFLAAVGTATVALVVAGLLFARSIRRPPVEKLEQTILAEPGAAAELLGRTTSVTLSSPLQTNDEEADRMGERLSARVTLIGPDGRVVGDSSETIEGVAAMENHGTRPEVLEGASTGVGRARRYSDTLKIEMLY